MNVLKLKRDEQRAKMQSELQINEPKREHVLLFNEAEKQGLVLTEVTIEFIHITPKLKLNIASTSCVPRTM